MASTHLDSILQRLTATGKAYGNDEPGSRETLLELAHSLIAEVELSSEFLQRTFWAEPSKSAQIRMAVNLKLFQYLRDAGEPGLTTEELAEMTASGVDPVLLRRLMTHLAAMYVIRLEKGRFQATSLSNSLAEPRFQASIEYCFDVTRPTFGAFPQFFEENGYQTPKSETATPFQYAQKSELSLFQWLEANPAYRASFAGFMAAYRAGKADWFEFYPVAERLVAGFDSSYSDVLLVDVGGGKGHDLVGFAAKVSSLPGKLVLQDQASVIGEIEVSDPPFEAQAHDFFTPQHVKARAYFIHSVLHDWSDEHGIRILENLKPALRPGYSRVLLNEIVVSEEKPSIAATNMDMMMLAHIGARERTEKDWRRLIAKAGFKITAIYGLSGVAESVIELEL